MSKAIFALATVDNLPRITALSAALAAAITTPDAWGEFPLKPSTQGAVKNHIPELRAALQGAVVPAHVARFMAAVLNDAGNGWETKADLTEMSSPDGKRNYGQLYRLEGGTGKVFTGKGDGSLTALFNTLLPADLAELEAWQAMPARAAVGGKGASGKGGVPQELDFRVAGISDAIMMIRDYTARNDVSFAFQHGRAHVKVGSKHHGTIGATGEMLPTPMDPNTGESLKGATARKVQEKHGKLAFMSAHWGRLSAAQKRSAVKLMSDLMMGCFDPQNPMRSTAALRPVWQDICSDFRAQSVKAFLGDSPSTEMDKWADTLQAIKLPGWDSQTVIPAKKQ